MGGAIMRLFKNELRRAIAGKGFWLAVALVFLMYLQDGVESLNSGHADVFSLYDQISTIGSLHWLVPCVGALCFAWSYLADGRTHCLLYCQMRAGTWRYCLSKVAACFLSAALSTSLGIACFLAVAYWSCGRLINFDVLAASYLPYVGSLALYDLIGQGHYGAFLFLRIALTGMTAGFWALFALMLSAFWSNASVVLSAPAILAYFKDYLYAWLGFEPPVHIKTLEWCDFRTPGVAGPLCFSLLGLLALSAVCAALFVAKVRRRFIHG